MHHFFHYDKSLPALVQPLGKRNHMLAASLLCKWMISISWGHVVATKLIRIQQMITKKTETSGSRQFDNLVANLVSTDYRLKLLSILIQIPVGHRLSILKFFDDLNLAGLDTLN